MWSRAYEVGAMKCYNDRCNDCSLHHNCWSLWVADDLNYRICAGYRSSVSSIPLDPIIDAFTEDIMNNNVIDKVKPIIEILPEPIDNAHEGLDV